MTAFTGLVAVLALVGGVGGVYYYFRKKTKLQVTEALKSLGDLPQDIKPKPYMATNTLESEGADLPNKEGDKPTGNSDSTKSSDDLTDSAPSSDTNKENESKNETNKG